MSGLRFTVIACVLVGTCAFKAFPVSFFSTHFVFRLPVFVPFPPMPPRPRLCPCVWILLSCPVRCVWADYPVLTHACLISLPRAEPHFIVFPAQAVTPLRHYTQQKCKHGVNDRRLFTQKAFFPLKWVQICVWAPHLCQDNPSVWWVAAYQDAD